MKISIDLMYDEDYNLYVKRKKKKHEQPMSYVDYIEYRRKMEYGSWATNGSDEDLAEPWGYEYSAYLAPWFDRDGGGDD